MPFVYTWIEPEVFLEYDGITIYHTYRDDDFENGGVRYYWYGYSVHCDDQGIDSFDVRDLSTWNNYHDTIEDHRIAIQMAIDKGEIQDMMRNGG